MTKIKIFKNNDIYTGFECSGHAGYAKAGKDIVCASISTLSQSLCMGIMQVLQIPAKLIRDDESGYIKLEMPDNLSNDLLAKVNVLFQTFEISIIDLLEGYKKYIKLEVIENVY